jgi:hypothetical protein
VQERLCVVFAHRCGAAACFLPLVIAPRPGDVAFAHRTNRPAPKEKVLMLISVVITLVVVGVLLWLVNSYIPMDAKIKQILNIVVVIAVILWVLRAFGLMGSLGLGRH